MVIEFDSHWLPLVGENGEESRDRDNNNVFSNYETPAAISVCLSICWLAFFHSPTCCESASSSRTRESQLDIRRLPF